MADTDLMLNVMSVGDDDEFSDVSYQSATDSALLSDIDGAQNSFYPVSEESTDMEDSEPDEDDENEEDELEDDGRDEEEDEGDEVDEGEDEADDEDDDVVEDDDENDDEDDGEDEDDDDNQEIERNVELKVVPAYGQSYAGNRRELKAIFDDSNSFHPRHPKRFNTRNSQVWTITEQPLSLFDYESYETHHWLLVTGIIITLLTFLAYFLVFRKDAKLRHLAPSSRSRKKKYEQLDAAVYDDDSYTYDDETP